MRGSISDKIHESVSGLKPGTLVFPSDFLHLGSNYAVNMVLSRLAKEGLITRIAKGVYFTPKSDPLIGFVHPSLEDVAMAIADKEQIRIRPNGAYALNRLGISTQVPLKVVYLTNGHPRKFKMGKVFITFRQTTPKVMAVRNDLIFLIIQALQEMGKDGFTEKEITHLTHILRKLEVNQIREDAKFAPVWIAKILFSIANNIAQNGLLKN